MGYVRKASASQINMLRGCRRKWYYSYVLKIKEPKSFPLLKGSLVHGSIENFYKLNIQKAGIHHDDYVEKFQAHMWEVFDAELIKPQSYFGKVLPSIKDDMKNIAEDEVQYAFEIADAKTMLKTFLEIYLREFGVQLKKYKNVPQAYYVCRPKFNEYVFNHPECNGFADAIIEKDGETLLVDYKSSQMFKSGFSTDNYIQLKLYCYLYYHQTGIMPSYGIISYIRFGKDVIYPMSKDVIKEMEELLLWYKNVTATIDIENYPMNTEYQFCTCSTAKIKNRRGKGWCFYADMCDASCSNLNCENESK